MLFQSVVKGNLFALKGVTVAFHNYTVFPAYSDVILSVHNFPPDQDID